VVAVTPPVSQQTPDGQDYLGRTGKVPPGATFNITPADMTEDTVNQAARSYAVYLFDMLDKRLGAEQLGHCISDATRAQLCDSDALASDLRSRHGIDIQVDLI
jgi:hypothetical protein